MKLAMSSLVGVTKDFASLDLILKGLGFVRWSWDYHKAVYDLKYTYKGVDYYLRIPSKVINSKHLENPRAILELQEPIFVQHFFPHGLKVTEVLEELEESVTEKLKHVEAQLTTK